MLKSRADGRRRQSVTHSARERKYDRFDRLYEEAAERIGVVMRMTRRWTEACCLVLVVGQILDEETAERSGHLQRPPPGAALLPPTFSHYTTNFNH